jgi:hypothetical protein
MDQETIQLPPVTTGIDLSSGAIQLLSFCIANCPLTEQQRANLHGEFTTAIKAAVDAMAPKSPSRITETADGLH